MDALYSPGISFENPGLARPAAPVRMRPWFYQETAIGPLTKVSKDTSWSADMQLHPYSPVWKRAYKDFNIERLGAFTNAMPNFEQLGEAPGPTNVGSSLTRDPLGFLSNAIAKGGDIATGYGNKMLQDATLKTQAAQSSINATFAQLSTANTWMIAVGISAAGIAAYFLFKK